MRVLLVEDDPMIGESVQQGLRQDGFAVDWVQDGEAAELALRTTRLYGWNEAVASNAVEVPIHHLHQKLEPALIRTVRGIGYMVLKLP
jgi:DNA-binding response OmpR family regulator